MSLLEIVLLLFTGATIGGVATSVGYAIGLSKRRGPAPKHSICADCTYSFVGKYNDPPGKPHRTGLFCEARPHPSGTGSTPCVAANLNHDCELFKPKDDGAHVRVYKE